MRLGWVFSRGAVISALAASGVLAFAAATAPSALAISIELKDVAPDRIERQRAFVDGRLPLAGTPDTKRLAERLAEKGLRPGLPVMLRIFKQDSTLELWMEKDGVFVHFATYPICHWSGSLGPKVREGDKQTPEGFYAIARRQLYHSGRWPISINLGFPNAFDRALRRGGSYILLHGGCSSVGCFAMTNAVITEIHGLARAALGGEQRFLPIHVFPFRMTDKKVAEHAGSAWRDFWQDLKAGYDSFERTRRPPVVSVCEGRYRIEDAPPPPASEETSDETKNKKERSRVIAAAGAVRESCPVPIVATAEGQGGLKNEFMSKLGGPKGHGTDAHAERAAQAPPPVPAR